ncbi:hypothetical protein PSV09DRAFT_2382422 [Bipolaris maydis]|uniref:uncharacterized protein n=1 Tax=Cochliobolus heterostrophus TaxID=5016 RepID=UPI0024DBC48E|nr:hypothetical protein J3E73DRAFT_410159 [Bipolaris maydis]KAJ5038595.1 hypothetical protein J3E74DRAFT_453288 [Bipolaris maydis]KAJ5058883.1 hypothetical protein J3E74DRAFT_455201 [Bipolaris maydis]KAJ6208872.1 hypothetical protein PSV09DRAFT_2382422 [Bipolaris maydis]KAJ6270762.1 hypothetical protein PSV08DRAFT_401920 [Bipolaris maydis]
MSKQEDALPKEMHSSKTGRVRHAGFAPQVCLEMGPIQCTAVHSWSGAKSASCRNNWVKLEQSLSGTLSGKISKWQQHDNFQDHYNIVCIFLGRQETLQQTTDGRYSGIIKLGNCMGLERARHNHRSRLPFICPVSSRARSLAFLAGRQDVRMIYPTPSHQRPSVIGNNMHALVGGLFISAMPEPCLPVHRQVSIFSTIRNGVHTRDICSSGEYVQRQGNM